MPDPSQTLKPMLIDGQWVAQENGAFDSVNPATGARNFRISGATQAEIDAAVDAGWRAVRQAAWRDMLPHARAAPAPHGRRHRRQRRTAGAPADD